MDRAARKQITSRYLLTVRCLHPVLLSSIGQSLQALLVTSFSPHEVVQWDVLGGQPGLSKATPPRLIAQRITVVPAGKHAIGVVVICCACRVEDVGGAMYRWRPAVWSTGMQGKGHYQPHAILETQSQSQLAAVHA
jgi:hypothetical protein